MCYLARRPWDTPDPNTSPPALHNARYNGWPSPPIQLPHVALPSLKKPAERRVAFAIDTPSTRRPRDGKVTHIQPQSVQLQYGTHPHRNHGAQGIMWPVECRHHDVSNSCMWNGGTHQRPSPQGVFETRTAARHDKENAVIEHDPSRRTKDSIPLIDKDTQIASLLAAPRMQLVYDLRYPPSSLYLPPSSPYARWGFEFLRVPLTPLRPKQIQLISRDFPWAFNIYPEPSAAEQGVTCLDVLTALHAELQRPLSDTEWGAATEDKHLSLVGARDRRLNMKPALRGSPGTGACTTARHRMPFSSDAGVKPAQREPLILRIDWLGSRVAFGGLVKDEAFARRRLIPGARESPETWVVRFNNLP
ncbi:uncharacterized protein EDB93DRAFT_1144487 [Suillus bovinus]|uniref:uncharacterized protein n=1 Tax=Suillus bovinus TaxID=48563 RepID=UPI001B877B3A|nr:uncharacterized protein EDB93DRAFT_1144487 [Suillus bovinus]KAG2148726.1 hypothetical protein EDB93DRAFT_1144487 [Suillus bovinus]